MLRRKVSGFHIFNYAFLSLLILVCIAPILHVIALSFSQKIEAVAGHVGLLPVGFNVEAYRYVMEDSQFWTSLGVTLLRVVIGVPVNIFLVVMTAYPLSKKKDQFHGRTAYAWYMILTIIFSGGLIPTYMVVKQMGLINSVWSMVLPGAIPVWNTVLMMNFYRNLPREIEESAFIDGANHLVVLTRLYIPLSAPAVATIALFSIVGHWNSWFDGLIYLNTPSLYPLQTFLYMIDSSVTLGATTSENVEYMREISDRTLRSAQIVIAMVPVLIAYPFLQKYFTKGIVMGSVKG